MEQDNFTNLTISQNAQIEQLVTDFRNDPKRSSRVRQITFPKAPEKGPPSVVQWSVPGMKKPNKETIDENGFLTIFEHCRFVEKIFLIDWSFVSLSDDTLSRLRDSFAHVTTFEVGFEGHFKPTSFFLSVVPHDFSPKFVVFGQRAGLPGRNASTAHVPSSVTVGR